MNYTEFLWNTSVSGYTKTHLEWSDENDGGE